MYAVAVVVSTAFKLVTSNVAYNPVCFLQKLVQVLQTEHIWLDRLRIVACEHLVENRRDVHGGVLRLQYLVFACWQDDDALQARLASLLSCEL